jgi:hypothetical protein
MQARPHAQRAAAQPVATAPDPAPVATEESTGNEEASVRLRFLFVRAMKLCAIPMQRCLSMPLCVCLEPFYAINYMALSELAYSWV